MILKFFYKILLPRTIILGFFLLIALGCSNKSSVFKKTVLQVGEEKISLKVYSNLLLEASSQLPQSLLHNQYFIDELKQDVLYKLIHEMLLNDWIKKNKIIVLKKEIQSELNKIMNQYPNDLSFKRSLAQQGHTFSSWIELFKKNLIARKALKEITKNNLIFTEKEIKAYYEQHKSLYQRERQIKLQHILVDTEPRAKEIYEKMQRDTDAFSELSKKYSIAPESKNNGHLGWVDWNSSNMINKLFEFKDGQLSSIITQDDGYHIFKILGKRKSKILSLKDSQETIKNELAELKRSELYKKWLKEHLEKKAVFINKELIALLTLTKKGNI